MKMQNGERAVVDIAKIRDYCLSPTHIRGRHKARVFAKALGVTQENSEYLANALSRAATDEEAQPLSNNEYGARYVIDFEMQGPNGMKRVRSLWIVLAGEDVPRFLTCYVL
ncbi:MAG: hypothetical protein Q7N50_02200 [Armatimonadota bacterium]|nr:hypothetical protein [Armatimonadota bacterium]